ncbi:alpha/beta hydrolase [Streptomyces sp. MUM 203J]|uniref:alpha/beta fold hydrolase n=1 Tax=Streptomyces sp. MUM 203J TaxID=2791990 RepID=UPI001F034399|nr:alpha/beta hydrolase [Streptomyces sp. MUM 203J]MCH0539119.1 alpha/beta hydrolase [Streptomyces sp. MUM 203J]
MAIPPADGAFFTAYDTVLRTRWPATTVSTTVPTPYGPTHVNSHGPEDGPPVILLPGGGATSTVWFATAAELGRTHRVHAVDLIGDPGRSVPGSDDPPVRAVADLMAWLDAVMDGLGTKTASLCGHSYGAWTALHYAVHRPDRLATLVLLDPTNCFSGFSPRYLLRAAPLLLRPTPARTRAFLRWETGGVPLDETWLALERHTAAFPAARPVTGPRPETAALRVPTLLLLAERSRAHDVRRAAAAARKVPAVRVEILPGATHHTLPLASPPGTDARVAEFLRARPLQA